VNKEAVNGAFKEAYKKLKAELNLKDNWIKKLFTKSVKKEKASKFIYYEISLLKYVYNNIIYI